jgi:hypothetical protein
MRQFSEKAIAVYAAAQGKGTAFALLQEAALQSFVTMEVLAEEIRQLVCERNELPAATGWATLDKSLSGPVKTLYVYILTLRKFARARSGVVNYYVASGKGPARVVTLEPFDLGRITASVATSNQSALKAEAERLTKASESGAKSGTESGAKSGTESGAKSGTESGAKSGTESGGLNVDAVIAQLCAMHKADALTPAQVEALASIRPATKVTPMAERADGLALAA